MSSKFSSLGITLLFLIFFGCSNGTSITSLKTEYQSEPIGIDEQHPRFSWQMKSDRYGARQLAYQITVATSRKALDNGQYVFKTEKVNSDNSLNIVYDGDELKPSTRYFWQVTVWDENNRQTKSDVAWFETGLLNSGWSNAQWIGSEFPPLSKYRSNFDIDYDVKVNEKGSDAVFIFGARDSANYVMLGLHLINNSTHVIISHLHDGVLLKDYETNASKIISASAFHNTHHINIHSQTDWFARTYNISIVIDGVALSEDHIVIDNSRTEMWEPYCRLYSIGFKQSKEQAANYSNIVISEKSWNTELYRKENPMEGVGQEEIHIWCPGEEKSAPMLRKEIAISKGVSSAKLYVTARGTYQFFINGNKVGHDFLNPGSSDFRHHIFYNTYDITSMLKKGGNALGAILGAGWYTDYAMGLQHQQDQYGVEESLLAKIIIEYNDGTTETVVTDDSWKCYDYGPVLSNSLQNGVDYDARREVKNWNEANFDDSQWYNAKIYPQLPDSIEIINYIGSPIVNDITLSAVSVSEPKENVYIYDMGQNMVGIPNITFKGDAGQKVTIQYGEMLYPAIVPEKLYNAERDSATYAKMRGLVCNENYRSALCTDNYILSGDPNGETFQPDFTYHGYRYLVIYGLSEPLPLEKVKGLVLHSAGKQLSSYNTSNEDINRLYENIIWSQRGNFVSVPTDCPQRDERQGWSGDAQIFARSATYNMNVDQFFTRWLVTVSDDQGENGNYCDYFPMIGTTAQIPDYGKGSMGWTEVGIIVPWQMYQQYGDLRIIEKQYPSMTRYMEYLQQRSNNFIQPGGGYGDWLSIEQTNKSLSNTAYYAYDAMLMSKMASATGKNDDAKYYSDLYDNIKTAFNSTFVDSTGHVINTSNYNAGVNSVQNTVSIKSQTSNVVPLQFDLFAGTRKDTALQALVQNIGSHGNTLTTGFIGTPYLNLVLSDNGYDSLAYLLFEQTEYPSWLYPVKQGATTIWERWNSYTHENGFNSFSMNSFNHYAYGSIEEWMMAYTIGIQRDEDNPGYKHFFLQPRFGGTFQYINGGFESVYGQINSGWKLTEKGYIYNAEIPANTTATLLIEATSPDKVTFLKGKDAITGSSYKNGKAVFELKSGIYTVQISN